jgi:recombination protein RecT
MNFEQIRQSWNQEVRRKSSTRTSPKMSKRTVINRTCKRLINTSSDAILMDDETTRIANRYRKVNLKVEKESMNAKVIEFELEQPEEAINEITVDPETVVNAEIATADRPNF